MNDATVLVGLISLVVGIAGACVAMWVSFRPERERRQEETERSRAIHDALIGQSEQRDNSGHLIREEAPGLVARVSTMEKVLATMTVAITNQQEMHDDIAALKAQRAGDRLKQLEPIVAALLTASAERAATADAAAQALRLVNERDVLDEGD